MPDTTLSEALKEALTIAPAGEVILVTLHLSHPNLISPIFLVRDLQDQVFGLESGSTAVFKACGFRINLPERSAAGLQDLDIAIDNVDRAISDFVNAVEDSNDPVVVIYRTYLYTNPNTPQNNPPLRLSLTGVRINNIEVTGKATFGDVLNRQVPTQLYTRDRFPSLANSSR